MRIRSVVFFILGGAIIAAAFFAEAIGLDNDPGWGRGRIAILVFGSLILAWGIFYSFYTDIAISTSRSIKSLIFDNITSLFVFLRRYWYTFPILTFVILVYVWFASSGSWIHWESATRHYADLATSFRQGRLYLSIQPNSDLLSLTDPYDPLAREGINYPVDYSLYDGKFYFYWGPVPSLILIAISPFTHGRVGDLYLVFSFVCGILVLQSLLAIAIWDRFFHNLPKWILVLSILVFGLAVPWTYILINEPNGRIYEGAISGAQFFLLGGFLVTVRAFSKPVPSSLLLVLTGCLWALAIGTRLAIALPIGFMISMIAYHIWKSMRSSPMSIAIKLISLSVPLILCFVGLGWYNWARFGSVTETGLSFALAGANMHKFRNDLFSPIYIIQHLYNYLLQPPASMAQFPFLYPKEISPVMGLLFTAPFAVFGVLPIVTGIVKAARNVASNSTEKNNSRNFLDWITINLLLIFSSAFCMILMYFWIAMRYLGDFMPALAILSALGFWQGYQLLAERPRYQKLYSIFGIVLAGASVIVNILLSISVKYLGRTGF